MNESEYESLMARARSYRPDTSAAELGFETRLMARLREMSSAGGADEFAEMFTAWLWRSVIGLIPIAAAAAVLFVLSYGLSMPAEAHEFADHLASWLPVSPFNFSFSWQFPTS
jgi:hypothetical protein